MMHPWSPHRFSADAAKAGRSQPVIDAAVKAARLIKRRDVSLPVIFTLAHLGRLAGITTATLAGYTHHPHAPPYRVFRLKKQPKPQGRAPSRGYRTICVPEPDLMRVQRWITQNILNTPAAAPHSASFAYYPGRGLKLAAERHAGCAWLLKMDVHDFFDNIRERRVYRVFRDLGYGALLSFQMARICTWTAEGAAPRRTPSYGPPIFASEKEGSLPQGAPTSPALANLAVMALDRRLDALAAATGWVYTRYADDLAFSSLGPSSRAKAVALSMQVKRELRAFGLDPNEAKTLIMPPGARRIVLGLLVDGPEPRLTRSFRNNLDTHLYALTKTGIGVAGHRKARKFASTIGMRRHITGLVAYAHHIEPEYAKACYQLLEGVDWSV